MTTSLAHRATVRTLVAAFVRTEATVRSTMQGLTLGRFSEAQ